PPLPALPSLPTLTLPTLPQIPFPTGGAQAAVVQAGADITLLGGGDLLVRSDFIGRYTATTAATPQDNATIGVGPSVSANAVTQSSRAEIQDARITATDAPGSDVSVIATGDFEAIAEATAGASNAINVPAAAALNYNDFNTSARTLNSSSTSAISGDLLILADHDALSSHGADTDSGVGGTASIGAAVALGYTIGGSSASSGMAIDVLSGNVTVQADNISLLDANAVTGQSGAVEDAGGDSVSEEIAAQLEGLLALAGQDEIPADVADVLARADIATADGPLGVAAALAMNIDFGFAEAMLAPGSELATATAPVIVANADMDASAVADAASVDAATGAGVAVAVNVDAQRIETAIGGDVTAPEVTLITSQAGDGINSFTALAQSGAGAADIGVAGAFALNLSGDPRNIINDTATGGGQHLARILDGASITLTAATDIVVSSTYVGEYLATATAQPANAIIGIGPSVALNAVQHATLAEIGDATIVGAADVIVSATGTYTTETSAVAGAATGVAVPAAIALSAPLNDTVARVRPGTMMSAIGGNLDVTATHTAVVTTLADAAAGGDEIGVGAAIAIGGPLGGAVADAAANMTVGGNVNVLAITDANATTESFASQAGALLG
ncbi:MAG: hypothetical protein RLW42_20200, partial [Gammaproteobacteria bacterium]